MPVLPKLVAVEFEKELKTGSTKPCVFQCEDSDGKPRGEYVAKLRAGVRGNEIGLQFEYLAWHLAEYFGIPRLPAALISIDDQLVASIRNTEVKKRLGNSIGLNFGTSYVPGFNTWVAGDTIPPILRTIAAQIVAFDALIENADRRRDKANLLFKGDELLILDHELAFSFVWAIGLDMSRWDKKRLEFLRQHPFHAGLRGKVLDLSGFEVRLKELDNKTISEICGSVPAEFGAVNEKIPAHLSAARENAATVMDVIQEIFK